MMSGRNRMEAHVLDTGLSRYEDISWDHICGWLALSPVLVDIEIELVFDVDCFVVYISGMEAPG